MQMRNGSLLLKMLLLLGGACLWVLIIINFTEIQIFFKQKNFHALKESKKRVIVLSELPGAILSGFGKGEESISFFNIKWISDAEKVH